MIIRIIRNLLLFFYSFKYVELCAWQSVCAESFCLLLLYEENLTNASLFYAEYDLVQQNCYARTGDIGLDDEEYPGWPNKFYEEKHYEDSYQPQEELTESFGITQAAIWKRFTVNGWITTTLNTKKPGPENWPNSRINGVKVILCIW